MRNNVQVARKLPLGTLLGQPAAHAIGVGMVQIPTQTVSTVKSADGGRNPPTVDEIASR
jgi:hypothetical protein